jgi:integrase
MKMALPRGMFRRGGKLWARKDVPRPLREILGQTSLQQTLGTGDLNRARVVFHEVMGRFEARIADAKAKVENKPTGFEQITISLEKLGISQEQAESYLRYQESKPENQMRATAERIERKLVEAGLTAATPDPVSLEELFEQWNRERKPAVGSLMEFQRAKDAFKKLNGDLPIAEYKSSHARAWKDKVLGLTGPDGRPLAHATLVKWFGAVKTLFKLADRNDLLSANPFAKILLERPKRANANTREDWDTDELKTLFSSPVYVDRERPRGGAGEAAYWLPVLALYHGFRAGELCQLDRTDVVRKKGIWCVQVRPSSDDDDVAKSVKTSESIRIVPLHRAVIELEFLDYVATVKGKKLFPKIRPDARGRWSGPWSKWFGRYRRDLGLNARWTDFHSFRHTWKTAARAARIPKEYHDAITGHENGSIGDDYGNFPIPELKEQIDKISFDIAIPKWNGA